MQRLMLLLVLSLGLLSLAAQPPLRVELVLDSTAAQFGALRCRGLDSQLLEALEAVAEVESVLRKNIKLVPAATAHQSHFPGMLGQYQIRDSTLWFRPRLPWIAGKTYHLQIEAAPLYQVAGLALPPRGASSLEALLHIPDAAEAPPTQVVAVYPSADSLPANLLKWYIEFSAPMSLESIYPHLQLLDEKGQIIPAPFLELSPELWDPEHRRLTLWMDPGRIKSHLSPHQKMGNPLAAGQNYTLQIRATAKNASGQALSTAFRKAFFTLTPDRQRPKPADWLIKTPLAGTQEPLGLRFPEAMDRRVLESFVELLDREGHPVLGEVKIGAAEKLWRFYPQRVWPAGEYQIWVSKEVEDLAGNNLERLFDTTLEATSIEKESHKKVEEAFILLEIVVKNAGSAN